MTLRARGAEGVGTLDRAFVVTGLLLALVCVVGSTVSHAAWLAAAPRSILGSDAPAHYNGAVELWWSLHEHARFPGLPDGYYPPGLQLTAQILFFFRGISAVSFQQTQLLFTALGCAGGAALGWRCAGPLGAAPVAAWWLLSPLTWTPLEEPQLDWPLAAGVVCALATTPRWQVGERPAWLAAVGGGLVTGGALLLKQAMLGFFVPTVVVVVGRAVVLASRRRPQGRVVLAEALMWLLVALAIAGPWYLRNGAELALVVGQVDRAHARPDGLAGLIWRLSYLGWWKDVALHPAVAWGASVGLLTLPLSARRHPQVALVALAMAGGLAQFILFGDPHPRHFVAVQGPVLALAVAPFGLLSGRWRLAAAPVSLALVATGLMFAVSWRFPTLPASWPTARLTSSSFEGGVPSGSSAALWARVAPPAGPWRVRAPVPEGSRWPV